MTCPAVRERLAEHALGVLDGADRVDVERHLVWCAACRLEADGLIQAAAAFAFAPASVAPPADLEDRVVAGVRGAMGGRGAEGPRRGRLAIAAALAAMLALSGLGWGAVMAGRAARLEQRVRQEEQRQNESIVRVRTIFETLEFTDGRASAGALAPEAGGIAGGAAMTVTSDSIRDVAIVLVSGLRPEGAPFLVELSSRDGGVFEVGEIRRLDPVGGATLIRRVDEELQRFRRLIVRDADGAVVLRGVLDSDAGLASPTPAPLPGG